MPSEDEKNLARKDSLRAVLNRTASSQSEENTFQTEEGDEALAKNDPTPNPTAPSRPRRDPGLEKRPLSEILKEAGGRALGGGIP
jgi:hypothetical protein